MELNGVVSSNLFEQNGFGEPSNREVLNKTNIQNTRFYILKIPSLKSKYVCL